MGWKFFFGHISGICPGIFIRVPFQTIKFYQCFRRLGKVWGMCWSVGAKMVEKNSSAIRLAIYIPAT
jgi:hypothetical protein